MNPNVTYLVSRLKIVKIPRMQKNEIEELINTQTLCRIAFKEENHPYMAPFQYVKVNGTLYFHFTNYGKKMRLFERDDRVCVEFESYRPDLSEYCFVVMRGSLQVVDDPDERAKAIEEMARVGSERLSENFLIAHGFNIEDGWSSFTPDKPLVMVKLKEVSEVIGLKYP